MATLIKDRFYDLITFSVPFLVYSLLVSGVAYMVLSLLLKVVEIYKTLFGGCLCSTL